MLFPRPTSKKQAVQAHGRCKPLQVCSMMRQIVMRFTGEYAAHRDRRIGDAAPHDLSRAYRENQPRGSEPTECADCDREYPRFEQCGRVAAA